MRSLIPDPRYHHPTVASSGASGAASPAGWLVDNIRAWFNPSIDTQSRAMPAPMGPRDRLPGGPSYVEPAPSGDFHLLTTRRFDRGAQAYGYRFGAMTYNPIGAGVVTTRPMEATKPAANELPFGVGITWEAQGINYGRTPLSGGGPLVDPRTAAALMGNQALAGSIPQGEYIAPPQNGFGG